MLLPAAAQWGKHWLRVSHAHSMMGMTFIHLQTWVGPQGPGLRHHMANLGLGISHDHDAAKMRGGHPLNDEDRQPWLQKLSQLMQEHIDRQVWNLAECAACRRTGLLKIAIWKASSLDASELAIASNPTYVL